jgi:hypothetical protein
VAALEALPADGLVARWSAEGDPAVDGHEVVTLRWDNEAWTATGRVGRERVEYVLRISPLWQVRQFLLFRDLDEPDLWLGTDGHGHWGEVNGTHRPELDGAVDIVLACSPFPLTLPVRRLDLAVGGSGEVGALAVDVETLQVERVRVGYERVDARRWRATTATSGTDSATDAASTVEFAVDDHGLPRDVPGAFRRLD